MKIPKRITESLTIKQDNDCTCFSTLKGKGKRAKSLSSKRLRSLVKKETNKRYEQ